MSDIDRKARELGEKHLRINWLDTESLARRALEGCAEDIAELEATISRQSELLERARLSLLALRNAASEVNRLGAVTGPQWPKLTRATIKASATLRVIQGDSNG